jgi:hypothetical protein
MWIPTFRRKHKETACFSDTLVFTITRRNNPEDHKTQVKSVTYSLRSFPVTAQANVNISYDWPLPYKALTKYEKYFLLSGPEILNYSNRRKQQRKYGSQIILADTSVWVRYDRVRQLASLDDMIITTLSVSIEVRYWREQSHPLNSIPSQRMRILTTDRRN